MLEPLQKIKQEEQGQHHPKEKVTSDTRNMLLSIRSLTVQRCNVLVPQHHIALLLLPSTKQSLLQRGKQEGKKRITVTDNLGQLS